MLRQMGVRFDRVTREDRTVLRILESPDAIHQWAKTANGITRVFDRPVEVDKFWDDLAQTYVIAANITGDLGRIVFSPNSLNGNLTLQSFLHHEAVHEKTNEANFTSPDSPRASWVVLFTKDGGPIDSDLPQEYQSRIRTDEILAYYKSLVFWNQVLRVNGSNMPPNVLQAVAHQRDLVKTMLLKVLPGIESLLREALLVLKPESDRRIETTALNFVNSQRSKRHILVTVRIKRPSGESFLIDIPYFLQDPVSVGQPITFYRSVLAATTERILNEVQTFRDHILKSGVLN